MTLLQKLYPHVVIKKSISGLICGLVFSFVISLNACGYDYKSCVNILLPFEDVSKNYPYSIKNNDISNNFIYTVYNHNISNSKLSFETPKDNLKSIPKVFEITRQIVLHDSFFQTFKKFLIGDEHKRKSL